MLASRTNKIPEDVWRERIIRENMKRKLWSYKWTNYIKESEQAFQKLRDHQEAKEEKFPADVRKQADYKMGNLPARAITPRLDDSHIPKYTSRMIGWKSTQPYSYLEYCKPNSWEKMPASIFTQLGWNSSTMN